MRQVDIHCILVLSIVKTEYINRWPILLASLPHLSSKYVFTIFPSNGELTEFHASESLPLELTQAQYDIQTLKDSKYRWLMFELHENILPPFAFNCNMEGGARIKERREI